MSRVGNAPVVIPKGVEISVSGKTLKVKGSKGELLHEIHHVIGIDVEDGQAVVKSHEASKQGKALSGTTRAILQNMVTGV